MSRRSNRATKGKNTYLEELRKQEEEEYQRSLLKPKKVKKTKEVVHCSVCKTTDSNYDESTDPYGEMIQCDECDTWQHINCMLQHFGIDVPAKSKDDIDELTKLLLDANDKYICDRCKYKAQVREERRAFREQTKTEQEDDEQEQEQEEPLDVDEQNDDEFVIAQEVINSLDDDEFIVDDDEPSGKVKAGRKRKSNSTKTVGKTKKKKAENAVKESDNVSSPSVSPPSDPYLKIRNNARTMVCNLFKNYIIPDTIKQHVYSLPQGATTDSVAESMSTKLEECLFEYCKANSNYKTLVSVYSEKVRVLFSNLKDSKNLELKKCVINGSLLLEDLVAMSATDLANPDLQSFKQKIDSQKIDSLVIPNQGKINGEEESEFNDEHHTQFDFSKQGFHKSKEDEEDIQDSVKETTASGSNTTTSVPSNPNEIIDDTLNVKFKFDYPEVDMKVVGSMQFLGSTILDESKKTKTSLNAVGDGSFIYEGRLPTQAAIDYINEIKSTRAVLLYRILPPATQRDSYDQLFEYMLDLDRVVGLKVKRNYEKNIYLMSSPDRIPSCIEVLRKESDISEMNIDFSRFDDDEKYLYLLIVVKPELL